MGDFQLHKTITTLHLEEILEPCKSCPKSSRVFQCDKNRLESVPSGVRRKRVAGNPGWDCLIISSLIRWSHGEVRCLPLNGGQTGAGLTQPDKNQWSETVASTLVTLCLRSDELGNHYRVTQKSHFSFAIDLDSDIRADPVDSLDSHVQTPYHIGIGHACWISVIDLLLSITVFTFRLILVSLRCIQWPELPQFCIQGLQLQSLLSEALV